ncbi:hypothetical protein [Glutamicibacter sp. NPDC087344]|uniref:hypothetical protein n=1 Tax=Glutamicibacter sp. NPDC087344 TaxID=3363994 RepID=UPI00382E8253
MAQDKTIEDSLEVSFNISLDTVIGTQVEYDEDGDRCGSSDITIAHRVAEIVGQRVAAKIDSELRSTWNFNAVEIAEKALDERVTKLLDEALDKIVTPTDQFGTPKGEPRSIAQLMHDRITAWFNSPADKRDSYNRKTNLQAYMDSAVDHRMKSEMDKAVNEAKKSIVAKMQEHAQALMADAVVKITGGK